ncbi:hypothetical protein F443_05441 [Phytophthora nicotianae P1569]|uniref:Uncharacterized protein n=1 Tax=Phytophthora nicotianae P1569 TaxID=1317065 RepID=V9FJH3_PHYNI|nr:hypothetical protein F443_05441 [Phytophthora nicotianae P1569]
MEPPCLQVELEESAHATLDRWLHEATRYQVTASKLHLFLQEEVVDRDVRVKNRKRKVGVATVEIFSEGRSENLIEILRGKWVEFPRLTNIVRRPETPIATTDTPEPTTETPSTPEVQYASSNSTSNDEEQEAATVAPSKVTKTLLFLK